MEVVENGALFEDLLGCVYLVQYVTWVPGQNLQFGCLFGLKPLFLGVILELKGFDH